MYTWLVRHDSKDCKDFAATEKKQTLGAGQFWIEFDGCCRDHRCQDDHKYHPQMVSCRHLIHSDIKNVAKKAAQIFRQLAGNISLASIQDKSGLKLAGISCGIGGKGVSVEPLCGCIAGFKTKDCRG